MPDIFFKPFKNEVKSPARTIITPCPKEKQRSINEARIMFLLNVANPIIAAKIGVEHGLAAKANNTPIKRGYRKRLVELPFGILFTSGEKLMSTTPSKFKPIIKIKEPRKSIQYAPPIEVNTFPVNAQNMPIAVRTSDKPSTKEYSCINVFFLSFSPNPPTYPTIRGTMPIEQGEIEANIPPKNEITRNKIGN